MYTVKQLADLAGVSRRTLHYYHGIGLLEPDRIDERGYRWYGEGALLTLQQILLFREMDMDLSEIKKIMTDRGFNMLVALSEHKRVLEGRRARLSKLLETIDSTMNHIKGENKMDNKEIFEGLHGKIEEKYQREAVDRWGETAEESQKLWKSYDKIKQREIMNLGNRIYRDLAKCLEQDLNSSDIQVQILLGEWHNHIKYFYEPTPEILSGLGDMYCEDPRFRKNIAKFGQGLPEFIREGIGIYVINLVDAED